MNYDWSNPKLVASYSSANDNPKNGWYENEVNVPSIISLLPAGCTKVLDFGCGPGDMTSSLSGRGFEVEGADASETMVNKAKAKHPTTSFFIWDGLSELVGHPKYDAIITKLTLEFVADLDSVAENMRGALVSDGHLVVSVMHPMLAMAGRDAMDYWNESPVQMQIGNTGLFVNKINHTIATYINTFLSHGFVLERVQEPSVPSGIIKQYGIAADSLRIPKRLNVVFKAKER